MSFLPSSRRPPRLLLLAALMAVLVLTLAVLQYRWVGQLSAIEGERLRASVAERTRTLAQDFDRELTRAFFWLQLDPVPHEPDRPPEERYARWYETAPHPQLVREIYRVDAGPDGRLRLQRFDRSSGRLVDADPPADFTSILASLQRELDDFVKTGQITRRSRASLIDPDVPALIIPRPFVRRLLNDDEGNVIVEPSFGYTIARVDREYLTGQLLPALVERYFARVEDHDREYRVAVLDARTKHVVYATDGGAPAAGTPDAVADLLRIRFEEFGRFVVEERASHHAAGSAGVPHAAEPGPPRPPEPEGASPGGRERARRFSFNFVRREGPGPANGPAPWRVAVTHQSGSLAQAVERVRRRNLATSFGVLLLLSGSAALIVVSTSRARRLARQQIEFVAGVSHELRTPLAVIRSAGENLADGVVADPKQVQRYGRVIATEGRRLTDMVEQVMEFAGMEAGRAPRERRPVDVGEVAREAASRAGSEGGAPIEIAIAPDVPPVEGDRPALGRAIQNLLSNALKYGGGDGPIGLAVERHGERWVRVIVSDRGPGVDPADLPHIFEPFYRGRAAVAAQIHGSGLGLSLVERIARDHGGRVRVESASPRGSRFIIELPAARPAITEGAPAGSPVEASRP